jgi:hypothetical protein
MAASGAGFLLAVLWFDLMFDVQARGATGPALDAALASISAYYARVTTAARPMNRLVAAAMLVTLAALVGVIGRNDLARWRGALALASTAFAVGLAGMRTVPNAVRLGRAHDDGPTRVRLARRILADHVACFVLIATTLALLVAPA